VAFFDLQPGLKPALWPRRSLARASGRPLAARSATEFAHGIPRDLQGLRPGVILAAGYLPKEIDMILRKLGPILLAAAAAALLGGCAGDGQSRPGPPHPGAANPYSNGGFHDAGPNYPNTGI